MQMLTKALAVHIPFRTGQITVLVIYYNDVVRNLQNNMYVYLNQTRSNATHVLVATRCMYSTHVCDAVMTR